MGESDAALASFQKALVLYEGLAKGAPADQKLRETLSNLQLKIGVLHNDYGNADAAAQSFRGAMREIERMQAANMQPDVWLATSVHYRMGELARLAGNLPAALQSQQRGLELAQKWAAQHPGDSAQQLLAYCQARLGGVLLRLGALDASLDAYTQSLRVYQNLAERFPQNLSQSIGHPL